MSDFKADFTAIDFETASHRKDSACQLAAVRVRDGKITHQAMWMIRPMPMYFSQGNIRIHGITPQDVTNEPTFGEWWPEIIETLGEDCLVAHNASFDMGVLLACLRRHRKSIPAMQFTCTRAIARRTWAHRRRFGLKPLSEWLGIRFRHHDALEDSIACAKVLLAAGTQENATDLVQLESKLRLSRGTADSAGFRGPSSVRTGRHSRTGKPGRERVREKPRSSQMTLPLRDDSTRIPAAIQPQLAPAKSASQIDVHRLMIRADFTQPLRGKHIILSGRLELISEDEAVQLVKRSGGVIQQRAELNTSNTMQVSESTSEVESMQEYNERELLSLFGLKNLP